jgi:voltage-gated potassium channel
MNPKVELFVVSVTAISVFVIIFQFIFQPSGTLLNIIYVFDFAVVFILAVDLYLRTKESSDKGRFILTHSYEIPALIPLFIFGLFESQSILEIALRGLRLVRLFRLVILFSRTARIVESTNNRILYTIFLSSTVVTIGALAFYMAESNVEGTKVTSISDAFWWAIVTVTTVGYGDIYPVTTGGKIIATFLMISGIAILGVLISTLGASLIESRMKKTKTENHAKKAIKEKVDDLELMNDEEIKSLNISINALHRDLQRDDSSKRVLLCSVCKHANLDESLYCNMCGQFLRGNI